MKIKEIEYFKGFSKDIFYVYLDDDNIDKIKFTCKVWGTCKSLFEVYVSYTNGRHMTYNHMRVPKKYNKIFNEYIKDYPTE